MYTTNKYKILPTNAQRKLLDGWEGSTRWLWNQMLHATTTEHAATGKFIWAYDLNKLIPTLKVQHNWLKDTPAHALQNVAFELEKSLKRATIKRDQGFPRYKSKGQCPGTIKISQNNNGHIAVSESYVKLPKIGQVKCVYHRPVLGKIKLISLVKELDCWYICVVNEVPNVPLISIIDKSRTIGIDVGVKTFATCSDGTSIAGPNFFKEHMKKLKKYQQRFARKKMGSNNRNKCKAKLAKLHRSIKNKRANWLHQETRKIVDANDVICIETLGIKQLLQKRVMSRSIADQGWGIFADQLTYKAAAAGKHLTKIGQYQPSTKTCSCCGSVKPMTLADREYVCPNPLCADYLRAKDRDHNAAMNIHFWGLSATKNITFSTPGTGGSYACGGTALLDLSSDKQAAVSLKQEAAGLLGSQ